LANLLFVRGRSIAMVLELLPRSPADCSEIPF
jgi:hypothetical protein